MKKNNKISSKDELNSEISRLKDLNEFNENKIAVILKLSDAINKNSTKEFIIDMLESALINLLQIEKVSFLLNLNGWEVLINEGTDFNIENVDIENELKEVYSSERIKSKNVELSKFKFIIPVAHKKEQLGFLLLDGLNPELEKTTGGQYCYVTTILNLTIIALENKKLYNQVKKDRGLKMEIDLAADVQKGLIPENFPKSKFFEFFGEYIPFKTVGGDYYDLKILDDENIAFCICDVAGKGTSAGMIMSNFQASVRTLLDSNQNLIEIVKTLNTKYYRSKLKGKFVTMFIAKYNFRTRKMEYINAGQNPPVLKNGKEFLLLEKGCTVIGSFEDFPFIEKGSVYLNNDSILVMYTDGFFELSEDCDSEYGYKNIELNILKQNDTDSVEILVKNLMKTFHKLRGNHKKHDDISLMCAKFK